MRSRRRGRAQPQQAQRPNPRVQQLQAGVAAASRQEVWFRITSMLNLDDSDIAALEMRARTEDQTDG